MKKLLPVFLLALVLPASLSAQSAEVSLDGELKLTAQTVRRKLLDLLPAKIDKGGWIQVEGGADDVDGPGFAYKLFLKRGDLRIRTVDTGFDFEVDVVFDVDVRKRVRELFVRPLLEGSTDDDRRATIKAQLRPGLGESYDVSAGLKITEIQLHDRVDVRLKILPLISKNLDQTVRAKLKEYLNSRSGEVDNRLNEELGLRSRLEQVLRRLSERIDGEVKVQQVQTTSPQKAGEALVTRLRLACALLPGRHAGKQALPRVQRVEELAGPLGVTVATDLLLKGLLEEALPEAVSVQGRRLPLVVEGAMLRGSTLRLRGRLGDVSQEVTCSVEFDEGLQALVLRKKEVKLDDPSLRAPLLHSLPDVCVFRLERLQQAGMERLRDLLPEDLIGDLGLRPTGFRVHEVAEHEDAERIRVTVALHLLGQLELK